MSDVLITTKISIPPARIDLIHRRRLLERLDTCVSKKLTLLSAPPGFGKTMLLSDWASLDTVPLAWYSLDDQDNDTDRFLLHFISAIEAVEPRFTLMERVRAMRQAPGPLIVDTFMTIMINELDKLRDPLAIVLDDYHLITHKEIDDSLSFLIDHLPGNIHLIIASRTNPSLPLAKLRAGGQLLELTERDLRFTTEEVTHFLRDVMGLDLSEEDTSTLESRTEGWVAGLQLAALSLEGRENPSEFISSLSGTYRYILDYLADEVFTKLPEILQLFLLRTSHLARINGDLCNAVVGDLFQKEWDLGLHAREEILELDSYVILEFLDDSNLFVFPLDYERQWYRFHPLFSEFLQDRLHDSNPGEIPELHQRAAEWFSEHGFISEAIHHALAAEDDDRAADLMIDQIRPALARGDASMLARWIERLPPEMLREKPTLDLALAFSRLISDPVGFEKTFNEHFTRLKKSLDVDEATILIELAESEEGSQRRADLSEFAILMAYLLRDQGDLDYTIELFKAALAALPVDDHFTRAFTLGGLASCYARTGELELAEHALSSAADSGRQSGSAYAFIAPKDWEATMQGHQGRLSQAIVTYREAIDYISELKVEGIPLTGHAYVGLADILYEKNELEEALALADEGIRRGAQVNDVDALREGYLIKARILLAMGDEGGYQEAIEDGIGISREIHHLPCLQEALAWEAIIEITRGEISTTIRWASECGLSVPIDHEKVESKQEIERRAFARLLLAQRNIHEAESVLLRLLKWTEEHGFVRTLIEILALLSLALHAIGRREEALRNLARALLIAEPEGYVRSFLDTGPVMATLLQSAAAHGHSPEYVKTLLMAFGQEAATTAPIEPLTERELDVLRLIADGMTNAQIADELVIAQSTVKTHINRIYGKLNVTQRTQAVARARELRLIQ